MTDISIALPETSGSSLQDSFEQLNLHESSKPYSAPQSSTSLQRPSLAESETTSSGSGPKSMKRTACEAWADENREFHGTPSGVETARRKVSPAKESGRGSAAPKHSGSSCDSRIDGDHDMSRSSSGSGGGSGSGSGTGTHDRRSFSTPATSFFSSPEGGLKAQHVADGDSGLPIGSPASLSVDRSSMAGPSAQPMTTYVNPSPTASTGSYPFVSTSFSAVSSSSSYSTNVEQAYLASAGVLRLNTNADPPPYTLVTFGAGTQSRRLDAVTAASQYGAFHVPTSAYPVGAGQFLAGGFGFLGRKHGLAMDNLVEAELVLADGRIVWIGEGGKKGGDWREDEDPEEVWWALRGAGAILGVVTRFRAKAFYLPSVFAGNMIL